MSGVKAANQGPAKVARRNSQGGVEPAVEGGDSGAVIIASNGSKPVGRTDSSEAVQPPVSNDERLNREAKREAAAAGDAEAPTTEQASSAERKPSQSLGNGNGRGVPVPVTRERSPPRRVPGPPCVHGSA